MKAILDYIKKPEWSPYVAGTLLGVVAILITAASTILQDPSVVMGASGGFHSLFGGLARLAAPDWVAKNLYYRAVIVPGITWEVVMLIGIVLGGALGAISSGTWKISWMPARQWTQVFGQSRVTRWALIYVGAIVLEISAGIAGGCTSGLAIWGGLQLAPGAFAFMAGMFAAGIPTALLVYRRRY